jgi:hypothetical protein
MTPHGTDNPAMVQAPGSALCLTGHGTGTQNGPHAASIRESRRCLHGLPHAKIAETVADVNVCSHTFRFIWPARAEALKSPTPATFPTRTKPQAGLAPH